MQIILHTNHWHNYSASTPSDDTFETLHQWTMRTVDVTAGGQLVEQEILVSHYLS